MATTLRWGILSTANIAKKLCDAIKHSETGKLCAVSSRSLEKAQAFASEQGIPKAYGSYEELLADPEIDIVYNALPNHLHAEWSIKAAQAGKHILHEKPFAVNAAQVRQVIEAVRENDVFLLEAFAFRAHPQTFKLLELIRAGTIGDVRVIQADFSYNMGENLGNIRQQNEAAGGGIMDVGCYCLNASRLIAGAAMGLPVAEPTSIQSIAHIGVRSRVDEYASAVMRFDANIIANLTCGTTAGVGARIRITGSNGFIDVPSPWLPSQQATLKVHVMGQEPQDVLVETPKPCYAYEVDACAELLAERNPPSPYMSWEDSLAMQEALDRWRAAVDLVFDEERG